MANFRRRRSATNSSRGPHKTKWELSELEARYGRRVWMNNWPAAWDITFHRRPPRRHAKAIAHSIVRGADPDEALWPLSKRPHVYYW